MAKKFFKKLIHKGEAIKYQMKRSLSNAQISKTLGIPESNIRYYRQRLSNLEVKKSSKLPKKYIDKKCELTSNKKIRERPGRIISIKINKMLEKDNALDKKGKLLSITISQVNRILKEKYGKPLKIKKVFYLSEEALEKILEFCKKIINMNLEGKNIFFTDKTKIVTSPNTSNESIRESSRIKDMIKKGIKKDIIK